MYTVPGIYIYYTNKGYFKVKFQSKNDFNKFDFRCTLHRIDGPAWITPDGDQYWFYGGFMHRSDGPAYISKLEKQEFYIRGQQLDVKDWLIHPDRKCLNTENEVLLVLEHL